MNILFFIKCLIGGGAERVTVNLSEEFVRRGHKVTIGLTSNIIDYQLDSRINVQVLPVPYNYTGKSVIIKKTCSLYNKVQEYWGVRKIIKSSQADVIVASWGSSTFPILRLHGSIPIIASEHNTFDREHTPVEREIRFFVNNRFNKVVVLTQFDKNYTKGYLNNTVVIPNPLTFKPISKEEYDELFPARKNILACGRVNAFHVKGFDNLIVAFSKIADKFPEWDLDIAGAGTDTNIGILKGIAKEHGIENRIHFLGFCKNINEVMKKHAIFVLSSRSEGFGMVITEAMAMGCPCVSYALTGPSEIINNGIDGILVENQNTAQMSEALLRMIEDVPMRRLLGENALNSVTRYSVEEIADQWLNLFKNVI